MGVLCQHVSARIQNLKDARASEAHTLESLEPDR